jgi:hypothetical protein
MIDNKCLDSKNLKIFTEKEEKVVIKNNKKNYLETNKFCELLLREWLGGRLGGQKYWSSRSEGSRKEHP